jgi:hypothetical protein
MPFVDVDGRVNRETIPKASYKTNRFWAVAFLTAESGIPLSNVTSLPAW